MTEPARRGTSNSNVRGSSSDRRVRRAWVLQTYQSDVPGFCRCYRCGCLLYNPDDHDGAKGAIWSKEERRWATRMTIDRITPGCQGGTYKRNNIRPACSSCNESEGGRTRA